LKTKIQDRTIIITRNHLKKISKNWVDYLMSNPHKLFKSESKKENYNKSLKLIKDASGFQITAFAGKAQNDYTHLSRLPDLGELNLLARLRAIQLLSNKPLRIILDGHYYARIFQEELKYISLYEKCLKVLSKLVSLNKEFQNIQIFFTVNELLSYLNIPSSRIVKEVKYFQKNVQLAYKKIGLQPKALIQTTKRMLPKSYKIDRSLVSKQKNELLKVSNEFIIYKAALSTFINLSKKKYNYQRITILKYSNSSNPRINLEMNLAPWNSTILFKNQYLNINTAINKDYQSLINDKRNYIILGEDNHFWGFSRNKNIFNDL